MKRILAILTTVALGAFLSASDTAAESAGKEITLKGKGMCAKCCLKQGDACENVVEVTKDGKKTTYHLADNQVSKDFHGTICKVVKPVSVTGTCKKVDGKLVVTASKIELVK
jgi:hypothetical protein